MNSERIVKLAPGQIIRCTVLHISWEPDSQNIFEDGPAWGRYSSMFGDAIEWIGYEPDTAVGIDFDKYELFNESNVPDEYWAAIAKHVLLGSSDA